MTQDPRYGKSSASNLHIVVKCPGQLQLLRSIRGDGSWTEPEAHADSDFGNAVHAAWAGKIDEMSLSEKQQLVKRKADSIENKLVAEIFGDNQTQLFIETRFTLKDPRNMQVVHSAQIDRAHYHDGRWLVLDLKSLYGQQDPPDSNWQLLSQAVCISDDDRVRNQHGEAQPTEFVCGIIQPLLSVKPELVRYSWEDIRRSKRLILQKLDESEAPEAPRIPGAHCKWCACAKVCDVSAAEIMAMDKRTNLGLAHLSPEMVVAIIPNIGTLKKRIKDFEAMAKQLAENGELPGYEIRSQEGNRFCQSQESIKKIHEALADYIPVEEIRKLVELPFGKLRDIFIELAVSKDRSDKVSAGQRFDELTKDLWQRGKESKRLVKKTT